MALQKPGPDLSTCHWLLAAPGGGYRWAKRLPSTHRSPEGLGGELSAAHTSLGSEGFIPERDLVVPTSTYPCSGVCKGHAYAHSALGAQCTRTLLFAYLGLFRLWE